MKILPGTSLFVLGTVCVTFPAIALAIAPPHSMDGRAFFLLALAVAGVIFGAIGTRDLRRVSHSTATTSSAA